MMSYEIFPMSGVGPLKFGENFKDVRNKIGESPKSFYKAGKNGFPSDHFKQSGIFSYYDGSGNLEALEFAEPAVVSFKGISLLDVSLENIIEIFKNCDPDIKRDEDGFNSLKMGVGVYAPPTDESIAANVESIIVFRQGYYD